MNCFTSLANIQILFDDPTIGYLPGAYSLGNGLLGKIFSAVFETDVEFTRNFAFRIERSAEPQSTAFYIVHPLLRELLCSEIYQGFHDRSFWVRNSLFSDFSFRRIFRNRRFPSDCPLSGKYVTFAVPFCVLVELMSCRTRFRFLAKRLFVFGGQGRSESGG